MWLWCRAHRRQLEADRGEKGLNNTGSAWGCCQGGSKTDKGQERPQRQHEPRADEAESDIPATPDESGCGAV